MSTSTARTTFIDDVVDFLWDQWVQIGVSGPVRRTDRWAIDPEPLLVATLAIAGRDPRLFDEVLDWLVLNGRLVSTQRLRNLTRGDDDARTLVEAALAWAGAHRPTLHNWDRPSPNRRASPLEPGVVRIARRDPVLESHGVLWPAVEPSENSTQPNMDVPAGLAFRFRLLLGIGARAEIIRFLWTSTDNGASVRRIAEVTAFAKRNVQEVLNALRDAGPVAAEPLGNEYVYSLHPAGWADILDLPISSEPVWQRFPYFLDWVALERVLIRTVRWLDDRDSSSSTTYILSSRARDLVEELGPDLSRLGVPVPDVSLGDGEDFLGAFDRLLDAIRRILRDEGSAG